MRELRQRERRYDRTAAAAFARVVASGDADRLFEAAHLVGEGIAAWRLAMMKVARLPAASPEIRSAFVSVWVETKMLPSNVGNRRVLASALRVLMSGGYDGPELRLYRGANARERRGPSYGFSWTRDFETARGFAEWWHGKPGSHFADVRGAVFETIAAPGAILLMRDDPAYYDEREVVVDPFRLGRTTLIYTSKGERWESAE